MRNWHFQPNLHHSTVGEEALASGSQGFVIAIDDNGLHYDYPKEVKLSIRQEEQIDYLEAANVINLSGADVCILEHEFGIFSGQNGIYILPLSYRLKIPLIVTLHTVLKIQTYNQKAVMRYLPAPDDIFPTMHLGNLIQ